MALGHGIDAGTVDLYFEAIGEDDFPLIGSQIVAFNQAGAPADTRYVKTASGFGGEATLFTADFWGAPKLSVEMNGGILNLNQAYFDNPGDQFSEIKTGAVQLNISGSSIPRRGERPVNPEGESKFSAESSIINKGNMNLVNVLRFENNFETYRSEWIATASSRASVGEDPQMALDNDWNSRWSSGVSQAGGEWFSVDMLEPQTFNTIILYQQGSANDYPRGYKAYLSNDKDNWGDPVLTGTGTPGDSTLLILPEVQNVRHVKIVQTDKADGLWWSIHEFDIALRENVAIKEIKNKEALHPLYSEGSLFIHNLPAHSNVSIYTVSGQQLKSVTHVNHSVPIQLPQGIYIIVVKNEQLNYAGKLFVK
ncbi:hypothetical protein FACS189421_02130 [Bacteroidia bacterium]|nr:hypothetical protein FACS189421_02130 [Bacteroidia bacterium]GHT49460.1 hypothetical protein FACS189440_15270 [Bacteroidia bacterium]